MVRGRSGLFLSIRDGFLRFLDQFAEEFRVNIKPGPENTAVNLGLGTLEFLFGEAQQLDLRQGRAQGLHVVQNNLGILSCAVGHQPIVVFSDQYVRGLVVPGSGIFVGPVAFIQGAGDPFKLGLAVTNQTGFQGVTNDRAHRLVLNSAFGNQIFGFRGLDVFGDGFKDGPLLFTRKSLFREEGSGIDAEGLQLLANGLGQVGFRGGGV